jgi:hypothetical protein
MYPTQTPFFIFCTRILAYYKDVQNESFEEEKVKWHNRKVEVSLRAKVAKSRALPNHTIRIVTDDKIKVLGPMRASSNNFKIVNKT